MQGYFRGKIGISVDKLIVIILFLFSLDFFDLSGALIATAIFLFFFFRFSSIKLDQNAILLLLFCVFYFGSVVFFEGFSFDNFIKLAVAPWGCYVLGYNLRLRDEGISITKLTTILALGFFIHGMLNLFSSVRLFGAGLNNNFRIAYDYWQNRQISVTTAALYYSPLALMGIGGIFFAKKLTQKILFVAALMLSLYATLLYQNRTLIMAVIVILVINTIIVFKDSQLPTKRKIWIIFAILVAVTLGLIAWNRNVFSMRTFFEGTNLFLRLNGGGQDRTRIWASFIFGDAWKYPFGGTQAVLYNNKPYVHNLWLDTFRRAGILPFLFLIFFTIKGIGSTVSFTHQSDVLPYEKMEVIVSLLLGMVILFMSEPIIEANPYIFFFPIIILGGICGVNRSIKETN